MISTKDYIGCIRISPVINDQVLKIYGTLNKNQQQTKG